MTHGELHSWLSALIPTTVVLHYFGYWQMVRRLKKNFLPVWRELGEPGFFKRNVDNGETRQSFSSFLTSRRYSKFGDDALTFYGNFTLFFLVVFLCLAAASLVPIVIETLG